MACWLRGRLGVEYVRQQGLCEIDWGQSVELEELLSHIW